MLWFVILFGFALEGARAANVTADMEAVAYFNTPSCPSGWSDLSTNATFAGRVIKGSASGTVLGTYGAAITDTNVVPTHNHSNWQSIITPSYWSLSTPPGNATANLGNGSLIDYSAPSYLPTVCSPTLAPVFAANSFLVDRTVNQVLNSSISTMKQASSNVGYYSMKLCRFDGTQPVQIPGNVVMFIAASSCPIGNGWAGDFSDLTGRVSIMASSNTSVLTGKYISGAAPVPTLAALGTHNHTLTPLIIPLGLNVDDF